MPNNSSSSPENRLAVAVGMRKRFVRFVAFLIGLFIANIVYERLNGYAQDITLQCGIAIILAVSLNIVNGLTGQFAIGHAGFMSVGAYTGASVTYFAAQRFAYGGAPGMGWMILAMGVGGLAAAISGYVVGVPSLRLRGDYLAIVTLGFGEIIRVLLENSTDISPKLGYMGGATGFEGVPSLSSFPVLFCTVGVVIVLTWNLKFSSHGLAFMSVREDEIAADAMGVNTTRIKVVAFVLSAFFAGVGGVLFAHARFFQPRTFGFILSMNYVVMIVLGGTGSISGAALAAVFLTLLPEALKPIKEQINFTDEYRQVAYALMLVLTMILRPSGAFGMGELSLKSFRRLWWRGRRDPGHRVAVDTDVETPSEGTANTATSQRTLLPVGGASSAPVLEIHGLTRTFGGLTAIADIEMRLARGELVGLIGPNGAGKTTLFNLLTGVYEPSAGAVMFEGKLLAGERFYTPGQRITRIAFDTVLAAGIGWVLGYILATALIPYATGAALRMQSVIETVGALVGGALSLSTAPRRRRLIPGMKPFQFAERGISRTFQNIRLFGNLTVLENVLVGSYLRRRTHLFDALFRTPRLDREEQANMAHGRQMLKEFGLATSEAEQAKSLPYGDQRRLEVVRALATGPRLLLLDEPAAGMNPQEKTELMSLIRRVRDEYGLTILLIEHDMRLVMGVCERIYVLDYGRIIAEGTPEEIQRSPEVIAAYLGEELAPSGV